jgi:hypothetical protein
MPDQISQLPNYKNTNFRYLSHFMLWNLRMNFIYLFSGALCIEWEFQKTCCSIKVCLKSGLQVENTLAYSLFVGEKSFVRSVPRSKTVFFIANSEDN